MRGMDKPNYVSILLIIYSICCKYILCRTLQYVEVVKEIGKEVRKLFIMHHSNNITNGVQFDIPVLDAWSAMEGFSNDRGTYLSDGLHLNDK